MQACSRRAELAVIRQPSAVIRRTADGRSSTNAPTSTTNILVVDDLPEKLLVYRTDPGGPGPEPRHRPVRARRRCGQVLRHDFAVILLDVQHAGDGRVRDGRPDPQAEAVGPHADHLPDRVRRRGAGRRGVRPRGGRLHPHPGRAGDPAGQGAGVRRPVPDDASRSGGRPRSGSPWPRSGPSGPRPRRPPGGRRSWPRPAGRWPTRSTPTPPPRPLARQVGARSWPTSPA